MILLNSFFESIAPYGLWLTYIFVGLAAIGMLLGILLAIFQNLKRGGLVAIAGFVGLIVLFFIGYAMSSDVVPVEMQKYIEPSGYKLSSGGLITFYVLAFVAFVSMIFGLLKSVITGN